MSSPAAAGAATTPPPLRARLSDRVLGRRPPNPLLLLAGLAIAAAATLPVAYLAFGVAEDWGSARERIVDPATIAVLLRTLGLALAAAALATLIAVPLAWLTARTDLPGRRVWATLTALPLVVPSYIGAYLLVSAFGPLGFLQDALAPLGIERIPSIYGFPGALLALTLFTYPLVLLPVRAALLRLDPQLEEAARGLGRSQSEVLRTVVLPQLIPAIGAGALLVALYVLSDFGAVSIMRFDSFTREIYVSYTFDRSGAAGLGAVLVVLILALLLLYSRVRGRSIYHRAGPGAVRPAQLVPLGRKRIPALLFCATVVAAALVLPVGVLLYWAAQGIGEFDSAALLGHAGNTLLAGGAAALAAGAAAAVVAVLGIRHRGPLTAGLERASYAGYALPGIVVALALIYFGTRVALPLYQTLAMLIFALAAHYLPLAVGPISTSLLQVPPRLEEAARGLGRSPLAAFRTVTLPLLGGGAFAGVALVFLHAAKELPATLLLAPIGFETLATDVWRQTSAGFFEAGAIPALVLLVIAAPLLYLLSEKGAGQP